MQNAVRKSYRVSLAILLVIVLLMGMHYFRKSMYSMASYLVYPVISIQYHVIDPMKQWMLKRKTIQELEKELAVLREEYDELLADMIVTRAQKLYGEGIKEILEFSKQYVDQQGVVAQVLARNFSEQHHFILINAGLQKGIELDMVVVYKNNLIGKIVEVFPWYSKACLITDQLCKVAAICSQTNTHGIHEGMNRIDQSQLCYVSHLDEVMLNDLVLSSGEGTIFPQGFALGKIDSITEDGFYKKISLKPLCDFASLDYCVVIRKK